ncbi:dolichyl-phosphate beta-glucosyltransferase [Patescibacteria group bacterium]
MDDNRPYLSVVIPAYNEGERIITTLEHLRSYLKSRKLTGEVLIVDDGSSDNTAEIVQKISQEYPFIKLLQYGDNRGKGYAVRYGMTRAAGKYVLFADADGSTPFKEFDDFRKAFQEGNDVVIGSRYIKGSDVKVKQPILRRILSRIANKIIQIVILWGIKDTQCGFKAFTNEAAKDIFNQVTIDRWGFDMEVLVIARKRGYKVVEDAVTWTNSADSRLKFVGDTRQTIHDLYLIKTNSLKGKYDAKEQA